LAAVMGLLAVPTVRDTGLDYDEAVYGHLARDFVEGRHCLQHMPGSARVEVGGRPFPLFVQGYLGAVKCWLLVPAFAVWGCTIPVMRFTMLACGWLGLLLLMLWARRTLGRAEALLAGLLLACDPAFFFPTVCDWGAFVPSFLCRCAGLLLGTIWWRTRRTGWMVATGAVLGLGFLNKIDFAVVLAALAAAAGCARLRALRRSLATESRQWLAGGIAFAVAASPMLWSCVRSARALWDIHQNRAPGQWTTKLQVAGAVLDGSYFHRLMEAGGLFDRMFDEPAGVCSPFGWALLLSLGVLGWQAARPTRSQTGGASVALLVALGVAVLGVGWLPEAVRIHHVLLLYPFPQLAIARAATRVWHSRPASPVLRRVGQAAVLAAVAGVLLAHVSALRRTQRFVSATGGRGMWSQALVQFAGAIRARDDLLIASLDWGFHEQLSFLTDGPKLFELTWNLQQGRSVTLLRETNCVYLIHPLEFSLFDYGQAALQRARAADPTLIVESHTNREGRVVFMSFRFAQPPRKDGQTPR